MNCEQIRQLISALVDQELNERERVTLDEHLAECSECAQYSEQIRELKRLTTEWEASQMPPEIERSILERAKQKPPGWLGRLGGDSYRIPRPVAWAAVLLLVLLSVNSMISRDGSTPEEQLITTPEDSQPVQHIILTEADIVQTYTTGSAPADL